MCFRSLVKWAMVVTKSERHLTSSTSKEVIFSCPPDTWKSTRDSTSTPIYCWEYMRWLSVETPTRTSGNWGKSSPPGYSNDKLNILLSGMVQLIQTHTTSLSMDTSLMKQMHQQPRVTLKGCSLLIVLKESYITQENVSHCINSERVQIPLPLPCLPFPYNIVHVHPLLLLLLSPLTSLHD